MTALASSAKANIELFVPSTVPFTEGPGFFASLSFDPLSTTPSTSGSGLINISGCGGTLGFTTNTVTTTINELQFLTDFGNVQTLSFGETIDATDTWSASGGTPNPFADGAYAGDDSIVYFGYRFRTDTMDSDDWLYAYGEISGEIFSESPTENTVSIYKWAYNSDENVGITAGAVPEPAAFSAFLGVFVLGVILCRRRLK